MAELLLTHGYFLYEDPKELQIMKPYAPLGILYLCSHLRPKGFDVDVFDTTFSSREALFQHLRSETAFGPGHLRQSDDARECGRNRSSGARGRMEDDRRWPRTWRLRTGIPAGGSRLRRLRRRRTHDGGAAAVIPCGDAKCPTRALPASLTSMPTGAISETANATQISDLDANPGRRARRSISSAT